MIRDLKLYIETSSREIKAKPNREKKDRDVPSKCKSGGQSQ